VEELEDKPFPLVVHPLRAQTLIARPSAFMWRTWSPDLDFSHLQAARVVAPRPLLLRSELALNRAESVKLPHYWFARPIASICA
jgi:hypothetical protein